MNESANIKDRRKYPRVMVDSAARALQAEVDGHGSTLLFDMSYSGAAIAQPKQKKITMVDGTVILKLITEVDEAQIVSRVIRVTDDVVALSFDKVEVAARIIIDRVVSDRMVGLNMTLIDPKHYSNPRDFDLWFHGPRDTNLYLWARGDHLSKCQMDMEVASFIYEDESFFYETKPGVSAEQRLNNQQILRKVQAIVETMEYSQPALLELRRILKDHVGPTL